MSDIIRGLENAVSIAQATAHYEAELARLRAQVAALTAECDRLNKWADGFSDAQLKERALSEQVLREYREAEHYLRRLWRDLCPTVLADGELRTFCLQIDNYIAGLRAEINERRETQKWLEEEDFK